jgi:hypothetical protein
MERWKSDICFKAFKEFICYVIAFAAKNASEPKFKLAQSISQDHILKSLFKLYLQT